MIQKRNTRAKAPWYFPSLFGIYVSSPFRSNYVASIPSRSVSFGSDQMCYFFINSISYNLISFPFQSGLFRLCSNLIFPFCPILFHFTSFQFKSHPMKSSLIQIALSPFDSNPLRFFSGLL